MPPAGAVDGSVLTFITVTGAAAVAIALKVTGEPGTFGALADTVLMPAAVPRIHDPAEATPSELLVAVARLSVPDPLVSAKVTAIPDMPRPSASRIETVGGIATAVPTVAVWLSLILLRLVGTCGCVSPRHPHAPEIPARNAQTRAPRARPVSVIEGRERVGELPVGP